MFFHWVGEFFSPEHCITEASAGAAAEEKGGAETPYPVASLRIELDSCFIYTVFSYKAIQHCRSVSIFGICGNQWPQFWYMSLCRYSQPFRGSPLCCLVWSGLLLHLSFHFCVLIVCVLCLFILAFVVFLCEMLCHVGSCCNVTFVLRPCFITSQCI